MPDDQPDEFERYVRAALARSRKVHTMAQLIRATGLHANTLYDLFNRNVTSPGPRTISLIADALEVPVGDLWAAWQGLEPPPDTMQEALRRHTEAVERQNDLLAELVGYVRRAAAGIVDTSSLPPEAETLATEALDEAQRRGLSRASSTPTRRPRPVRER